MLQVINRFLIKILFVQWNHLVFLPKFLRNFLLQNCLFLFFFHCHFHVNFDEEIIGWRFVYPFEAIFDL